MIGCSGHASSISDVLRQVTASFQTRQPSVVLVAMGGRHLPHLEMNCSPSGFMKGWLYVAH